MSLMRCTLADRADQSLSPAGWIDADEVEDFAFVKISLGALQIAYSEFFYKSQYDIRHTHLPREMSPDRTYVRDVCHTSNVFKYSRNMATHCLRV